MIRRKNLYIFMALLFSFSGSNVFGQECPIKRKLKIGWKAWPPFKTLDEKGIPRGRDMEPVVKALKAMNCSFELVELPWKRAVVALRKGNVDLVAGAVISKNREKFAHYSIAYRKDRIGMVFLKTNKQQIQNRSFEEIFNRKMIIGTIIGNNAGVEYEALKLKYRDNFLELANLEACFKMLQAGRVNFVLGSFEMLHWRAKRRGIVVLEHSELVTTEDIHVLFSKKKIDKKFVELFDREVGVLLKE